MNAKFLLGNDRKKLLQEFSNRFGIVDPGYLFIETGKSKIRGFSGSLAREDIMNLDEFARIELIGTYIARDDEMTGLRLSFDAPHIKGIQVTKNVIELNAEEFEKWRYGEPLAKELEIGIYVVSFLGDTWGCGYSTGQKLLNYIPKERIVKKKVKKEVI